MEKNHMRRFVPALAGIGVVVAFFFLQRAMSENARGHLQAKIEFKAVSVKIELLNQISSQVRALIRMAKRWETSGKPTKAEWDADAALYVEHNPTYQAIEWVDASYRVRWIMPMRGNEAALNLDISSEEKRRIAMEEALKTRKATITRFIDLAQGGKGFLVFVPIFRAGEFEGFILGVFRIDRLLASILDERTMRGMFAALYDGEQQIYQSGNDDSQGQVEYAHEIEIVVHGATWRLWVWPDSGFLREEKSWLAEIVFALGIIMAFLLALSLHLVRKMRSREKRVKMANERLTKEIAERRRLETALEDRQARLRTLINYMMDGLIVINERGIIEEFNPAAERIFGYEARETLGKNIKILMPEPHANAHDDYIEKYIRTGESRIIGIGREVAGLRKDGSVFPMDLAVSELFQGERRSFVGTVRDITMRKEMESQLLMLSSAIEQSPAPVMITNVEGKIEYVNPSFTQSMGYSSHEVIGKNPRILKSGKHPPEFYKNLWDTILDGKTWTGDLCNRRKDGSLHWELNSISPIRNTNGDISHFLSMQIDDTERKRAEEALRENETMLRGVLDNSSAVIYAKDIAGRYLLINRRFEEIFKISCEQIKGKTDHDLFSKEDADQFAANDRQVLELGKIQELEETVSQDGERHAYISIKAPLRDANGKIRGICGISTDITERKRMEENLRFSEERSRRIIETANDAFISIDDSGLIREWNSQAEKTFGWQRSEVVGKLLADLIIPAKFRESHLNGLKRFLSTKQGKIMNQRLEMTALHRKGHEFPVEMSVSPMPYKDSYRFNAFISDMTEKKVMQVELAHAQKMEAIGQLAAGIAHEINTPMQFIGDNGRFLMDAYGDMAKVIESCRQLLEACRNGKPAGETAENVENLMREADLDYLLKEIPQAINQSLDGVGRVSKIVRAMKEFSHPGGEDKKLVDINKAIETTVTVSKNEWKYVSEVKLDLDPDLPPVLCFVDSINQVILNLIVNAAHAIGDVIGKNESRKGTITISTRQQKNWVEIRVGDTGTGIPEDIQSKIFDPFFTTKPVGKGTGQGLSLVHTIVVKKHQGAIMFETVMGKGTTFIVLLPMAPPTKGGI